MRRFNGDVIVITGGSGGIGLATAQAFVREGARVYLVARNASRLQAAVLSLNGDAHGLIADLSDDSGSVVLAEEVRRREGRLDVLVNCAGQLDTGTAEQLGADVAERLIRINYLGAVRAIAACLPLLRAGRRRSIVNVCSIAGRLAPPGMAAYAASKFALTGYTLALRQEMRCEHFHVGLVFPGPVATAMTDGQLGSAHYPLPPGVPVIGPEQVARVIMRLVHERRRQATVPWRLGGVTSLAAGWPALTDSFYRWLIRRRRVKFRPSNTMP